MAPFHPSVADLQSAEVLFRLDHANLPLQIRPFLFRWTLVTTTYWALNLLVVVFAASRAMLQPDVFLAFSFVCVGMVLGYPLLLPLHEATHAAAYRALGFQKVSVRYEWRRLTAFCVADHQVLDGRQFVLVAVSPFFCLNALLLLLVTSTAGTPQLLLTGTLLLHLGACSGDAALVNGVWLHRRRALFTYDDVAKGESRFVALSSLAPGGDMSSTSRLESAAEPVKPVDTASDARQGER